MQAAFPVSLKRHIPAQTHKPTCSTWTRCCRGCVRPAPDSKPSNSRSRTKSATWGAIAWQREMLLKIVADDEAVINPEDILYYDERPKNCRGRIEAPRHRFSNFAKGRGRLPAWATALSPLAPTPLAWRSMGPTSGWRTKTATM